MILEIDFQMTDMVKKKNRSATLSHNHGFCTETATPWAEKL